MMFALVKTRKKLDTEKVIDILYIVSYFLEIQFKNYSSMTEICLPHKNLMNFFAL